MFVQKKNVIRSTPLRAENNRRMKYKMLSSICNNRNLLLVDVLELANYQIVLNNLHYVCSNYFFLICVLLKEIYTR